MLDLKKLKEYRLKAKLKQSQVADKVGIAASHYSNIETGNRGVSFEILDAIVQVLGITIKDVWTGDDIASPALPTSQEKGIVVENGEGRDKLRYILPPTPESYAIVKENIAGWKNTLDPPLSELLQLWDSSNDEQRQRFLAVLKDILADNATS